MCVRALKCWHVFIFVCVCACACRQSVVNEAVQLAAAGASLLFMLLCSNNGSKLACICMRVRVLVCLGCAANSQRFNLKGNLICILFVELISATLKSWTICSKLELGACFIFLQDFNILIRIGVINICYLYTNLNVGLLIKCSAIIHIHMYIIY